MNLRQVLIERIKIEAKQEYVVMKPVLFRLHPVMHHFRPVEK
jgi:hypothetical protein